MKYLKPPGTHKLLSTPPTGSVGNLTSVDDGLPLSDTHVLLHSAYDCGGQATAVHGNRRDQHAAAAISTQVRGASRLALQLSDGIL